MMRGNKVVALLTAALFAWSFIFQGVQGAQLTAVSPEDLYIYQADARNVSSGGFEVDITLSDTAEILQTQVVLAYTTDPYFEVGHHNIAGGRLSVKTLRLPEMRRTGADIDGGRRTYTAAVGNAKPGEEYYVYVMLKYEGVYSDIVSCVTATRRETYKILPIYAPPPAPIPWPSFRPSPSPTATPAPSVSPSPSPSVAPAPSVSPSPAPVPAPTIFVGLKGGKQTVAPNGAGVESNGFIPVPPPVAVVSVSHNALQMVVSPPALVVTIPADLEKPIVRAGRTNLPADLKGLPTDVVIKSDNRLWIALTVGEDTWYYRVDLDFFDVTVSQAKSKTMRVETNIK